MSEANARIIIDSRLRDADWVLHGDHGVVNVDTELNNESGSADYVLKDRYNFPICVLEAKNNLKNPLDGKEQARRYAKSLNCRFVILSNSVSHYLWDIQEGNPIKVDVFPSLENLELIRSRFNPPRNKNEEINDDYIAQSQLRDFKTHPEYLNEKTRDEFVQKNKLRLLRDYQLEALKAVQNGIAVGNDRFLLEMATGTGKTLISSALIKNFIRIYKVKRVLFLVDRIELEKQAKKEFDEALKNDYRTVIWKENKTDWNMAEIVVSTVQSFISRNKYRKIFKPDHFDLVISDEAHRSLGMKSRKVFEYFIGFKIGLTATPKDYLKSVDIEGISNTDPRRLEKRLMLDTYTTFGCQSGEPTFRYSLEDGVKKGYLVNPKVIDARTEITTELLSEQGHIFQDVDDDGNDIEKTFTQKDFEDKFFSDNTNTIFCETFLKHAKRDPYTGEIGKTLMFCVSQNHAAKMVQILNVQADRMFPKQYSSDFAVQVTSNVQNSQFMTIDFRNNNLNGQSKINSYYKTSKTRVCVTVRMMTTGYDCTDILNICMVRPIFSPSEFIQMKGRGTRKNDFIHGWIAKSAIPDNVNSVKEEFILFDFFGNYDYFEKDFDYDEVIKLPLIPPESPDTPLVTTHIDAVISTVPDSLAELKQIIISQGGMKIDRNFFYSFKKKIVEDEIINNFVKQLNFSEAETYLKENILNNPKELFTLEKLSKSLALDRRLIISELLLHTFGHIDHIPSKRECLDEEFDKLDKTLNPVDTAFNDAKRFFEAYATDSNYRDIIDNKRFAELRVHTSGNVFNKLPHELRQKIPLYIKQNVNLERFENVG